MTKKLHDTKSLMELDIHSFLNSHLSSDSDDEFNSVPHRTLDEILNDSDSSTSPSSPTSSIHHSDPSLAKPQPQNDGVSSQDKPTPKPSSFHWVKSNELSGDPIRRVPPSSSRQLPSLFGGVRSTAKPGAALAAAAAASRSAPTPHAAAIKSRRAGSGTLQKVIDGDDHEVASISSNEISVSGEKLEEDEEIIGDFQSSQVHFSGELSSLAGSRDVDTKLESEVSNVDDEFLNTSSNLNTDQLIGSSSRIVVENLNLSETSIIASSDDANDIDENRIFAPGTADDDSMFLKVNASSENSVVPLNESDRTGLMEENLKMPTLEMESLDEGMSTSNDDEVGADGSNDDGSIDDISELVEERIGQLESEIISRRAEKKMQPSLKPLELAEELEKKQASTGLHWEEGAAAQPMRLEGVRRGSTTLGYFDVDANNTITQTIASQAFRRDHGSPQVLAVHPSFLAVGMSKGVIVVVPSKYSAHHRDSMDSKMMMLGLLGDRSPAPVTAMCFNQPGDLLLAGYADGHVTVWDVQRASAAKVITGEHTSPVVHTLFLGQDSQVTRQFKAVTGDTKGFVQLHSLSVVPLLNRFSIKTQCLLDGQKTGIVLSASPLLFDESCGGAPLSSQGNSTASASSIGSMMGGVVGSDAGWKLFNEGSSLVEEGVVIFVTYQTALVVRLTPTLEVYAQISRPEGVREGAMPYTAWKCMKTYRSSSTESVHAEAAERVSLLAIAWDRKVQVAKLVKSELKVYGKWSLDSAAIGVSWLDDQMLVVLTLSGQLYLYAKDGTVIHQTSFAVDGSRGYDLVGYHTYFTNVFGNPEKSYHNCVSVRGASIYVLGPMHLVVSRLLPWKERIQVLRKAGDWMGALNMAMTLYDGQAHGVIDLPRTLDAVQEAIMPYLVELLLSYVDEVFSYISVAFCNQIEKLAQLNDPQSRSSTVHTEIREQFTRVGGVAVEFCVHINRSDILFDDIFSKFVAVQHRDTFLELLEPYILKDMLGSLPPEIMQALVEHYSSKGWLQRVEQCVLHMDISSLDFNQVVRLCREHGLYGALVYLFNKGLDDFRAPLEELLVVLRNSQRESAYAIGYRMLVYLKYCFEGLAFPPGHGTLPSTRLPSLRTELLQFLLEESDAQKSQAASSLLRKGSYLNLYHLLELDTEATLDILRCAFVEDETPKSDFYACDMADANMEPIKGNKMVAECQSMLVQNTVNALVRNLDISPTDGSAGNDDSGSVEAWPSEKDIGHLFEFIAYYVACGRANFSKNVLSQILQYLTSEKNVPQGILSHIETSKRREKQLLALLEAVPETDWNASDVLHLCENAHFYQVCGLIHTIRYNYLAALDSYMKDVDEPIHAFSFIHDTLLQLTDNEYAAFCSAVISRIPELICLSREATFFLVIDRFNDEASHILSELRSHPKSLFLYLKTVVEVHLHGTLNLSYLRKDDIVNVANCKRVKYQSKGLGAYIERISDFPKFLCSNAVHVTDDMIELYLELLCQYERGSVLKFLETFDSYRVEYCLRLCQEYGITDAAAFLLERVGDVGSALLLTLSELNDKFTMLETAVGSALPTAVSNGSVGVEHFSTVLNMEEVNDINNILHSCIGLCQRNTPRLNPEESEMLWFKLLDSFCEPLMGSFVERASERENHSRMLEESFGSQENAEACTIKWRISKSHRGSHILRKLFSRFIKEIVEGMIGYVHLPTIMSKLLSDNGSQEFGDFKVTILGMLGTYSFERRILDTAKSLIEDDTFYTMSVLKKEASHGYAPRSLLCCICNCLLTKNSSSFQIRVFNCGHATHIQCELLENESSSKTNLSGCPLCMPKKNTQRSRNKTVLAENGLVSKFSSRPQQSLGTTLHSHESDTSDNSNGIQQLSRFEILNNLQKDQRVVQIENMPQLRLAPPAIYHEKVKKGTDLLMGESSSGLSKTEKPSKNRQLRELKLKGSSSLRFPLRSSIFGKEKTSRR